MVIGYARVSRIDQRPELQLDALQEAGCERVYTDKVTGDSETRYQLRLALEAVREGDVLVVWALDRLARNLAHLIKIGAELKDRGVDLKSLKEGIDTTSAAGRFAFHVWGAMAEFERSRNSERAAAAAAAAKRRGRRWGRRPAFHDPRKVALAKSLLREGSLTRPAVAAQVGVHVATLYKWFPGGDPDAFRDPHAPPPEEDETEAKAA